MSRGPGRLQRQIVKHLEATPERRLSRRSLEETFVEGAGYGSSNLLRAIRSLERMHRVHLHQGASVDQSYVSLPRAVEPVSDELIAELLKEIGGRR
jgi:hypothetical protein